ncbi:MAG: MBL fold metallo-hydrolase [Eubacteriales bacterium]|nr:MBL fold metallo-hydrolase [Eubacteriales bacterium]
MTNSIGINEHSSIRIAFNGSILYFDPFHINGAPHDADLIFISHSHYDHFSPEDIVRICKPETMFVLPESMHSEAAAAGIPDDSMLTVIPGDRRTLNGITLEAVPAYNVGKPFHPKDERWVGYIVKLGTKRIYVCGDTDALPENLRISCDVLLIPVGGKYTMDSAEAAAFTNRLKPQLAIPTHYGTITGTPYDGMDFSRRVNKDIGVRLLMGESLTFTV